MKILQQETTKLTKVLIHKRCTFPRPFTILKLLLLVVASLSISMVLTVLPNSIQDYNDDSTPTPTITLRNRSSTQVATNEIQPETTNQVIIPPQPENRTSGSSTTDDVKNQVDEKNEETNQSDILDIATSKNNNSLTIRSNTPKSKQFVEKKEEPAASLSSNKCKKWMGKTDEICSKRYSSFHNCATKVEGVVINNNSNNMTALTTQKSWSILITVNDGYYDFFINWWAFYDKLNLTIDNIYIIAEDDVVYTKLMTLSLPHVIVHRSTLTVGPKDHTYDSQEYKKFVSNRATYIVDALCADINLIYVDIDTVWLQNPLPYFEPNDKDILIQIDNENWANVSPYYCTGLMAVVSNERTVQLMGQWENKLLKNPQLNQPIFNQIIHTSNVKHAGLPIPLFPGGHHYFNDFTEKARQNVVAVHNNYIIGHDVKKERFQKHGLWLNKL